MEKKEKDRELKKRLRKKILTLRESLLSTERQKADVIINEKLLEVLLAKKSQKILLYSSFKGEVDLKFLIDSLFKKQKDIYLPYSQKENFEIKPLRYRSEAFLQKDYYGIVTPLYDEREIINANELDAVVVPGVVFDRVGYRIGYGAGYYDRFLSRVRPDCLVLGVAYDCQIVNEVPRNRYDIPVQLVITEKKL